MHFENLLDIVLGKREVLSIIECPVCELEEIYYKDPATNKQTGRACSHCNFVQKFDFDSVKS
ncbi:hypothetical protein [Halalkalibacter okhensis]|uniref:Acyltransferase n=1 Tax=Halalkalibacter okhensis TaxID=333138 RepID=A0A0B0IHI2_9BACI|nr:hypothetical protein [Halalkalibacter okhensis]KHF39126.1 acyltransferase [Halalkalibacter okhensis]